MKINGNILSPLLLQNSYSKLIMAIKTLSVDKFSNFVQILLTHLNLASFSMGQNSPRCDAIKRGVLSGAILFAGIILI